MGVEDVNVKLGDAWLGATPKLKMDQEPGVSVSALAIAATANKQNANNATWRNVVMRGQILLVGTTRVNSTLPQGGYQGTNEADGPKTVPVLRSRRGTRRFVAHAF